MHLFFQVSAVNDNTINFSRQTIEKNIPSETFYAGYAFLCSLVYKKYT